MRSDCLEACASCEISTQFRLNILKFSPLPHTHTYLYNQLASAHVAFSSKTYYIMGYSWFLCLDHFLFRLVCSPMALGGMAFALASMGQEIIARIREGFMIIRRAPTAVMYGWLYGPSGKHRVGGSCVCVLSLSIC